MFPPCGGVLLCPTQKAAEKVILRSKKPPVFGSTPFSTSCELGRLGLLLSRAAGVFKDASYGACRVARASIAGSATGCGCSRPGFSALLKPRDRTGEPALPAWVRATLRDVDGPLIPLPWRPRRRRWTCPAAACSFSGRPHCGSTPPPWASPDFRGPGGRGQSFMTARVRTGRYSTHRPSASTKGGPGPVGLGSAAGIRLWAPVRPGWADSRTDFQKAAGPRPRRVS